MSTSRQAKQWTWAVTLVGVMGLLTGVPSPARGQLNSPVDTNQKAQLSEAFQLNQQVKQLYKQGQYLHLTQSVSCPNGQTMFVRAETQNFFIYICSENYIGIAKNGSGNITLPLVKTKANFFISVNHGIYYRLTNKELTVLKYSKDGSPQTIVQERVIKWNTTPEYKREYEYGS